MHWFGVMDTVTTELSTRQLRSQVSDVLGRAVYAGEQIGVTRNGKLTAVVVSVADLEALEEFEMAQASPPTGRPRSTTMVLG